MSNSLVKILPGRIAHTGAKLVSIAAATISVPVEPRNSRAWRQIALFLEADLHRRFDRPLVLEAETKARGGPAGGGGLRIGFEPVRGLTCM